MSIIELVHQFGNETIYCSLFLFFILDSTAWDLIIFSIFEIKDEFGFDFSI